MDDGELASHVEQRPAIWDPRCATPADARRNRAAWRELCRIAHPDFDRLPPDVKRDKCLLLQKRWMELRRLYFSSARGVRRHASKPQPRQELIAKLAFLADVVPGIESSPIEIVEDVSDDGEAKAAKRPRNSSSAVSTSVSAELASSSAAQASSSAAQAFGASAEPALSSVLPAFEEASASASADEDRLFLLSLVSYMQEVPRRNRLALRRDMLALIARYASDSDTAPNQR